MVGVVAIAVGTYWFHFRTAGSGSVGRKLVLAFLTIAFLGGTAYYIQKLPLFFRLISVFSSTDAMKDEPRLQYFFNAVGACAEHPLLGLGTGGFALARYGVNAENVGHYSHSSVSETLSCNGVPGFLLYFGSRLAFFGLARRTRKLNLSANEKATVNMLLAYLGALILFDIVAVTIQDRLMWPLMGAACGYLWHLNHRSAEPSFLAAAA
jgi:O-antigen ligase